MKSEKFAYGTFASLKNGARLQTLNNNDALPVNLDQACFPLSTTTI